jgi:hypothetical protein
MKNKTPETKRGRRILGRTLIVLAALATLVAAFYTEEDWRGKRAWENAKREIEAKGVVLDWNALIPPPVPDDENFFAAPKMQEWFVKMTDRHHSLTNDLTERLKNPDTVVTITNAAAAEKYLARSDQFEPDFDLIREALKRPYARMDGNYTVPFEIPIPNFVAVRIVAQTLAQRAKCNLLLGRPEAALRDVTLLTDFSRLLKGAPTGKPMTLVAAMINVAVTGLYADTVGEGLRANEWQAAQLVALQKQLAEIELAPLVAGAFESEPAMSSYWLKSKKPSELFDLSVNVTGPPKTKTLRAKIRSLKDRWWDLAPRGWVYQNVASYLELMKKSRASLFDEHQFIHPSNTDQVWKEMEYQTEHLGLFDRLDAIALPNFSKAMQALAFNQTKANEAQIVCALQRYQLAHGEYPEMLDTLMPQFIEKIPRDLIGGQPLHYRRTDDGKFLLYSVGWNETDDDGQVSEDRTKGDWVWQYPKAE